MAAGTKSRTGEVGREAVATDDVGTEITWLVGILNCMSLTSNVFIIGLYIGCEAAKHSCHNPPEGELSCIFLP